MKVSNPTFEDLPPLEEICSICQGQGVISNGRYDENNNKPCYTCRKTGIVMTEFGQAIFDLMRKYKPWESDLEDVNERMVRWCRDE